MELSNADLNDAKIALGGPRGDGVGGLCDPINRLPTLADLAMSRNLQAILPLQKCNTNWPWPLMKKAGWEMAWMIYMNTA